MNDPRFEVFPVMQTRRGTYVEHPTKGRIDVADAQEPSGEFGWRFRDANGRITFIGGEGFTRREDAHRAVKGAVEDVLTLAYAPLTLAHTSDVLERLQIVDVEE